MSNTNEQDIVLSSNEILASSCQALAEMFGERESKRVFLR